MTDAPHTFTRAIVRRPAPTLGDGLTTSDLGAPDPALAQEQFDAYVAALEDCALEVSVLDAVPAYPDAHFVEDTAVVLPEVAIVARPGAPERRGEAELIAPVLAEHRPLARIEAPGTLDGGDVLVVGRRVLVGLSARTNAAGAEQFGAIVDGYGYATATVPVGAGLHLKSSVNLVGPDVLLATAGFADRPELRRYERFVVPAGEEYASCALLVNDRLLVPAGHPATSRMLAPLGEVVELDTSEFRKLDGGMTCLSLRF